MTGEPTGTGAFVSAVKPIDTGMVKQLLMLQVGQVVTLTYDAPSWHSTENVFVKRPRENILCL